ncbi:MAG: ATP-binding cassette domain-containing protein [Devosia sp.]|nr:ATP-binding cassette domain-containing protein [Devosia sp.]
MLLEFKGYGRRRGVLPFDLTIHKGEVVGVAGLLGSGRTEMARIMFGADPADQGTLSVNGKPTAIRKTTDAIKHGIETIYQDSALVTQLSIARNLFLGREPVKGPKFLNRLDQDAMNAAASALLKQVGIRKDIPPTTPIGSLSGGERQAVAIARAMHFDSDLIVLDEPTNNLGVAETQVVLRFVRNARDSGHSCIFIAHNIHHVFQVVDRIVIMRRGAIVADDIDPKKTSIEQVEKMITGMDD